MAHDDTICAIATPPGEGGIGVVRVSGSRAVAISGRIVRLRNGRSLAEARSHHLQLGDLYGPVGRPCYVPQGEALSVCEGGRMVPFDVALVAVMRAPRSYTGEDVVEFHCHSGPVLLRRVCESLLAAGARPAEPGEFTKRAFLNGRLDLAQAEGVLDTIRARTDESLRVAQDLMRGRLSQEVQHLQDRLTRLLAHVEAGIDFVEEDIAFATVREVDHQVGEVLLALGRLVASWDEGRLLREGAKVVIVGRPNVGKSSLLNTLLKTDRAIVTPIPGTTRDVLEEAISIQGTPIRLVDTAGVRDTADPVEMEGVRRTRATIEDADLALIVIDGSMPMEAGDRTLLHETRERPRVVVVNKADQPQQLGGQDRRDLEAETLAGPIVEISALTGLGIEALRMAVLSALRPQGDVPEGIIITRLRHRDVLERTRKALSHVQESVRAGLSPEFLAVDLRSAVNALGELSGTITTDDILERIFSEFCIGK